MSEKFWESETSDEYELEKLTNKALDNAEIFLGVKLPTAYVNLLKVQNGGRLYKNKIVQDESYYFDYLYGIPRREDDGILMTPYLIQEWGLPENIVLLSGDGHTWLFLDYRKNKDNPSVSYIDIDRNIDIQLASDFKDFVDKLFRSEDDIKINDDVSEWDKIFNQSYTKKQLEGAVKRGNNVFVLTASFEYFANVECDLHWYLKQTMMVLEHSYEQAVIEVLNSGLKKLSKVELNESDKEMILSLAQMIKEKNTGYSQKYYEKFIEYYN